MKRTGDWKRAQKLLAGGSRRLQQAMDVALRQEAHVLRNEIVRGITQQAPGGKAIRPLSPMTLAVRKLQGFRGTKALIRRTDLRNSIDSIVRNGEAFIGVPRKAKSKDGKSLVDVAQIQEFGGPPVVIRMTPKMRRLLFAAMKKAGIERKPGSGTGVVVTQVPARPFLRPAFAKFRKEAHSRFLKRVAKQLGFGGGV